MDEWTDPRYEYVIEPIQWEQDSHGARREGRLMVRGFIVAEPDESRP
ncbi:hypothetical protein [Streptomyces xanthophaeus]